MNKVVLMGRLTRDPEITYTNTGHTVAKYTLAVDRRYRKEDGQEADFIRCVVFGKGAEFAENYLYKGIKILVAGRIQTGSYTKQDGTKVYTTDVIVEDQEFTEKKQDNERETNKDSSKEDEYLAPVEDEDLPWN